MNQKEFLNKFNSDPRHVYQMNPALFKRSDEDILYYVQQLYLSIQKQMGVNSYYTVHIQNFEIIEDYASVKEILSKYQEAAIKKSVKLRGTTDNRFNFIDLKESDVKILVIEIYIEAYDGKEIIESVIAVPRIVDGQYIILNGNVRQLMWQLVDASTYNNQTSNSKNQMVVFKTQFQPIKLYRNVNTLYTVDNEEIPCITFDCETFSKSVTAVDYIFAKMGLLKGLEFLGLNSVVWINKCPPQRNKELDYVFAPKKNDELFIAVPKSIFQVNHVLQHIIYTLVSESSRKFMTFENMFDQDTWLEALGKHFSITSSRSKAISVLSSFEMVYDLITKEITRLEEEDKRDVYTILRWLLYEYNSLIMKSNLDVYAKRIRTSEYCAYLIAPKLSKAIYALSDLGEKVNLAQIKQRILIPYDWMLTELAKQSIVVFNDTITDCDSFNAIRYSRNGPSAINEGNSNANLPDIYRYLHPTSLGILDDCASGNSAPGIAGILVPLANLYPGGYFNPDYKEPNTWREALNDQLDNNDKEKNLIQIVKRERKILNDSNIPEFKIKDFQITEADRERLLATANR